MNDIYITETEYRAVEQEGRDALAAMIQKSGLPYNVIARATRVERKTVRRAAKGLGGVRADTAARIRYFISKSND